MVKYKYGCKAIVKVDERSSSSIFRNPFLSIELEDRSSTLIYPSSHVSQTSRQLSFDCCEMNPNKKRTESGNTEPQSSKPRGDVEKPGETQY